MAHQALLIEGGRGCRGCWRRHEDDREKDGGDGGADRIQGDGPVAVATAGLGPRHLGLRRIQRYRPIVRRVNANEGNKSAENFTVM
jgi:hypothetical protein